MAELLSRGAEQFKKEVIKYSIPHIRLGRDRLFDSEEVIEFLTSQGSDSKEIDLRELPSLETSQRERTPNLMKNKRSKNKEPDGVTPPQKEDSTGSKPLLSEKEAANFLGVSKMTLLRKRKAKLIKHYRVGIRVLYSKQDHLIPFLKRNER